MLMTLLWFNQINLLDCKSHLMVRIVISLWFVVQMLHPKPRDLGQIWLSVTTMLWMQITLIEISFFLDNTKRMCGL